MLISVATPAFRRRGGKSGIRLRNSFQSPPRDVPASLWQELRSLLPSIGTTSGPSPGTEKAWRPRMTLDFLEMVGFLKSAP